MFFFKIILAILSPLEFDMNFSMGFSISAKNTLGIFIESALNLYINLGSIVILTVLSFPVHEHRMSFYLFVSSLVSFIIVL